MTTALSGGPFLITIRVKLHFLVVAPLLTEYFAPANLMSMPIETQSMDGGTTEKHQPPSKSELDKITRGSMVKVIDSEKSVWYWVVVERRLEDNYFIGRIDAHCVIGPTLRHGGTVTFHEDNILYIWPRKVDSIFNATWFRILSHVISFGAGVKALKRPTD